MAKMDEKAWDDKSIEITKIAMDQRIKTGTSYRGWQHTVKLLFQNCIPFKELKVAEVGCGTGTFSLTFGLLGASVTLIDYNQNVIDRTKKLYALYDCRARFIRANCLEPPSSEISGDFDLVVSGGLAEHFTGEDRERCILYHRLLLKEGGMAFIGVPNMYSPFYQWIRFSRKLTGTWGIELEVPFSNAELKRLAAKAGFKNFYVIGNAPLIKDLLVYSRGFVSALIDTLPDTFQKRLRMWKSGIKISERLVSSAQEDIKSFCANKVESIRQNAHKMPRDFWADRFSAGLILFAFN